MPTPQKPTVSANRPQAATAPLVIPYELEHPEGTLVSKQGSLLIGYTLPQYLANKAGAQITAKQGELLVVKE